MLPVRLAAALAGLALVASPLVGAAGATVAPTVPTGPDVSRWQHGSTPLDWTAVGGAGNGFAFVKATESSGYINPWFAGDTAGIRAAGMVAGSYHFARPALPVTATALAQARHYVAVLGVPAAGALPPVLDLEQTGGLSQGNLVTWAQTFLGEVHRLTGRAAIVYTYPYFWRTAMADSPAFHRFPLWIASYTAAATPVAVGGWPTWTFWQYTDAARFPGLPGSVDGNRLNPTAAALADLADGLPDAWPTSVPAAPSTPAGVADGTAVALRWVPGDDGGAGVTGWTVRADTGQSVTVVGSSPRATVTGLPAGRSVTFTVTPRNALGAGATSPASAPVSTIMPTSMSTTASASVVTPGLSSTVTGRLVRRSTGAPLAGRLVGVDVRPAGTAAWVTAAQLLTGPDGRVSWTARPIRTTQIRLRYAGSRLERPSTALRSLALRPVVAARLSATGVPSGTKVFMTGTVSGGLGGTIVYRQRYYGGRWHISAHRTISPVGTYSFGIVLTVAPGSRTYRTYRVLVPAAVGHRAAVSPIRHLLVG